MNKKMTAYLELSGATILAGSSVVVGKLITTGFPVFLSQGISLGFALMLLIPLSLSHKKGIPRIPKKDLFLIFMQAFTGMFLFRLLLLHGLKYTTALESAIITSTTPAIAAFLSYVVLREAFSRNKIAGIAVATAGVLIVNLTGPAQPANHSAHSLFGNALVLLAVVCEALLTIFRKLNAERVPPVVGTTLVTLFSFLLFLPVSIRETANVHWGAIRFAQWGLLAYYGIIVTAVAYILMFSGISKVTAGTAAVFMGCIPVTAVILSCVVLKERFTYSHLAGIALVLLGILFISVPSSRATVRGTENLPEES